MAYGENEYGTKEENDHLYEEVQNQVYNKEKKKNEKKKIL